MTKKVPLHMTSSGARCRERGIPMKSPGYLPALPSIAMLLLALRVEHVGSFVAPSHACARFAPPPCNSAAGSPLTQLRRTRHACRSSSIDTAQDGTIDNLDGSKHHNRELSMAVKKPREKIGETAAEGNNFRAKPPWVEDPDEDRVKIWIQMAGRKGEHDRVAMYLRKYREGKARRGEVPSVRIYNAALRALDECQKWKLALSVFREMQADGVAADRNSYFFVVSACSRRGAVKTALELIAEMRATRAQGGPAPDLLLYAVAVKACAVGKSWREALILLDEMSATGVRPNVVVVNTVLSACAKCGQVERAKELLRDMKEKHGVTPDVVSYNSVISGHERAGEWREALALARQMERSEGISPTVVTFNSAIGACKRAGRSMEALAVLGLLRRKGLRPDVISFNSAMSACASGGKWEEALELLDLMPSEGVKPDLTTYNTALNACVKSGQWEIALSLFEELTRSSDASLAPDLYSYNTFMGFFSDSGMLLRALDLLEEAKDRGLRPDVITYSTLIRACERASPPQPEVALRLVADMETAGVRPNNTTFVSVALSLGRAGKPLECLGVLDEMRERGTPPDAICRQTVLRVLDRWDRAEEAIELFEEMKNQGLTCLPDIAEEMYCCGIRALEKLGRWSTAVALLEEWRNLDSYNSGKEAMYDQWYRALSLLAGGLAESTDAKTARAAIVSAARGGLAEQALAIMQEMDNMGFDLGVVEYGAVMEALEQSGKPERSLEIFDEMVACGVEPDVLCFAAATRCCCKRGDWESAISVLEATLRKGLLPASRTIQSVAGLCRNAGKYEPLWDLKELMRDMAKEGTLAKPGSSIYASLIRACGAAGRADLVLRCLAEMNIDQSPGRDWRIPALDEPFTVSAAVGALSACNETVEADRLYVDAIRRGIFPDPAEGKTWTAAASRARSATAAIPRSPPLPVSRVEVARGSLPDKTTARDSMGKHLASEGLGDRDAGGSVESTRVGAGGDGRGGLSLWVDLRKVPIAVVPSAVRRVVQAMKNVGGFIDGLVVQWGGARRVGEREGEGEGTEDGGGRSRNGGGNVGHTGRRMSVLAAFGCIEPPLKLTEPPNKRGQMRVEREEMQRWLREIRTREGVQPRRKNRY